MPRGQKNEDTRTVRKINEARERHKMNLSSVAEGSTETREDASHLKPLSLSLEGIIAAKCRSLQSISQFTLSLEALQPSMCSTPGDFTDNGKTGCTTQDVFTFQSDEGRPSDVEDDARVNTGRLPRQTVESDMYHSALTGGSQSTASSEEFHTPTSLMIPSINIVPSTCTGSKVQSFSSDGSRMTPTLTSSMDVLMGSRSMLDSFMGIDEKDKSLLSVASMDRGKNRTDSSMNNLHVPSRQRHRARDTPGKAQYSSVEMLRMSRNRRKKQQSRDSLLLLRAIGRMEARKPKHLKKHNRLKDIKNLVSPTKDESYFVPLYTLNQTVAIDEFFMRQIGISSPERKKGRQEHHGTGITNELSGSQELVRDTLPPKSLRVDEVGRRAVSINDVVSGFGQGYLDCTENRPDRVTFCSTLQKDADQSASCPNMGSRYSIATAISYVSLDGNSFSFCQKMFVSMCLALTLFTVALSISMLGLTLLELGSAMSLETPSSCYLLTSRAVGGMFGFFMFGLVFDKLNKFGLMTMLLLCCGVVTALVSAISEYVWVVIIVFLQGLLIENLDMGSAVMCISIWGLDSAGHLRSLQVFDSIGYITAPLMMSPFLIDDTKRHNISSNDSAFSWADHESVASCAHTHNDTKTVDNSNDLTFPYLFAGGLFVTLSIVFFVTWILLDKTCLQENHPAGEPCKKRAKHVNLETQHPWLYKLCCVLVGLLNCFHFGLSTSYQGLLLVYMVKGQGWTQQSSVRLATSHYASFSITRIIGIVISKHTHAPIIVLVAFIVTELMLLLDIFLFTWWDSVAWVSSIVLGMSLSLAAPSSFTWIRSHLNVTGRTAAVIRIISTVGLAGLPALIGNLLIVYGAVIFDGTLLAVNTMSIITFTVLYFLLKKCGSVNTKPRDDMENTDITNNDKSAKVGDALMNVFL